MYAIRSYYDKTVIKHYSYSTDAYQTIETNLKKIEDVTTGIPAKITQLVDLTTTPGSILGEVSSVLYHMYDSATGFDIGGVITSYSIHYTKLYEQ